MTKRKKTGGRQLGTRNKRTVTRERAVADVAAQIRGALGPSAFAGDAHALLMAIYKDERQSVPLRLDAAKAAIGYEKPRLAARDITAASGESLADLIMRSYKPGDPYNP